MLATNRQLAAKLSELEKRLQTHDGAIVSLIQAIKELSTPEQPVHRKIGFQLPSA